MVRAALISLVLFSCQKRVFVHQEDGALQATRKEITIDVPSESDIVIVIDNSGSMEDEIKRTSADIINFVRELSNLGNKFRIAVVTTDVPSNDPSNASCDIGTNLPPNVDAKNNGRCGRFLKPANRTEAFLDSQAFATPEQMAARFAEYVNVGSTINIQGSPVEQPIKAAYLSLDPKNIMAGAPNAGFFRSEALLLFILITDESDCSYALDNAGTAFTTGNPPGLACYKLASELEPPEAWAQRVAERRGDRRLVAVGLISSAMRDPNGTLRPSGCIVTPQGGPSDQCDCFLNNSGAYCEFTRSGMAQATTTCTGSGCCIALANDRVERFARQFKNQRDTICQSSFAQTLVELARLADQQCFPLERLPLDGNPDNLQIELKRAAEDRYQTVPRVAEGTADGWFFDGEGTPRICLQGAYKRKINDTIRVFSIDDASGTFMSNMR